MKTLPLHPSLVDQVHAAILPEVATGRLPSGTRIIQEQVARELGISRQPVQQALTLLRKEGVLQDAPGRGLLVAAIDLSHVRHMYDMRAVIEGLAFRKAAESGALRAKEKGPNLLRAGRKAVAGGSVRAMIAADMAFHNFIYELSGNPLVIAAMATHWTQAQRVMGEVLLREDKPRDIWDQHEQQLNAVIESKAELAERLARDHITEAANFMMKQLSD
jgi:DNA-binding GntR family transcriptional regulator